MNVEKLKTLSIILCVVIIAFLIPYAIRKAGDYNELKQLNSIAADSLQVYKDKDGYNRGRIGVLETQNTKTFLAFQTQDSVIKKLQAAVEENSKYLKNQGNVTVGTIGTNVNTSAPTNITYITNDSFPTYSSKFNLDGWVYGTSIANKDSTYLDFKVKNDFTLVIGQEKQGFLGLGKPKTFADIKLENPYSEVESMRTYQVTPSKTKRFGIGPSVIVTYNNGVIFYPGLGLNYNVIQF